jgi:PAS domain-containing protein
MCPKLQEGLTQESESQVARSAVDRECGYRDTFNEAAAGIMHTATDGRWLRLNRRACEMLGYSEAEALGVTFLEHSPRRCRVHRSYCDACWQERWDSTGGKSAFAARMGIICGCVCRWS